MTETSIIGVYEDEDVLLDAIHHVQNKGITIKDVYSPIPLHGVLWCFWNHFNFRIPLLDFSG